MRDSRLDLGRYITNPFNRRGDITKRLDFDDLFTSKAARGEYPFNPSRFESRDLTKRAMTRKLTENPGLNFTPNTPFFDDNEKVTSDYQLFEGLGRFNRVMDYDFETGRPRTRQRPQEQPDFNPDWMRAYAISPTANPNDKSKNPMPRMKNPDPNGFLMAQAEGRAEREFDDVKSVAQLLAENPSLDVGIDLSPEEVGEEIDQQEEVAAEETPTEKSPE